MSGVISDEVLSIVRDMLSSSARYVTLPSHVVSAMVKRIDLQDQRLHDAKKAELRDRVKHEQG